MGPLNFTIGAYAETKGSGAASIPASTVYASGAFTTTTSAATIPGVTAARGQVFMATPDVDMWVNFDGQAAAVGTGHFMAAGIRFDCEVSDAGTISVVDVA